ncbi:MAG TPA: 6-bladed beta-propeller [Thermomicrobiales bacterium]|nr:6-bladed beta-propeller [Thermomicrobiales bacterium]
MTVSDATGAAERNDDITAPPPGSAASPLDGRLDVGRLGWFGVWAAIILVVTVVLRFVQLDAYVLSQREGDWAHDAWILYSGRPMPSGQSLPVVSPLFMLAQSGMYFLFGVTDAIARSAGVVIGSALVLLIFALRPWLSRPMVLGTATLAAVSPTLVFASRTVDPAILVVFFALLAVVAVLRAGLGDDAHPSLWAAVLGGSIAAMIAAGPEGISSVLAVAVGLVVAAAGDSRRDGEGAQGPVSSGLNAIIRHRRGLGAALAAFVVVSLLAFSRLLSNASALEGFVISFRDWGRMMATQSSTTPTQFFVYAALLYEFLAVILAIVAVFTRSREVSTGGRRRLDPMLFLVWFIAALILQSLASGRQPDQTVLVTLPLVLLGGMGLGRVFERMPWRSIFTTRDGVVLGGMFGLLIGLIGMVTLIARANDPGQSANSPWLRVFFILLIVVVPFTYLIVSESRRSRFGRLAGWSALTAAAVVLGLFTIRTTTQLAYVRADTGVEMIAQRVPTQSVRAFVDQTLRLSRDLSLTEVSNSDNTGSFGLTIAVDPAVEAPFTWYFRDFNNLTVTGPSGWNNADMVIAPTNEGMENAGYVVESRTWLNRVPPSFESLGMGSIWTTIFQPSEWYEAWRFLMYRDMANDPVPEQLNIGYTFRLANQMNPSAGPFDLETGQSLGPGTSLGQLNSPTGVAYSPDGQIIYIVDSGNQRIQRFARDGAFIGAWSAEDDPRRGLGWYAPASQGASDIIVGPDGLIYVADTWNHRVMVLDAEGNLVRELGRSGEISDTGDSTDPSKLPGLFYGPRSIAIADDELYVTDTGNERVQVFASDGTFLRAFGGTGSEPGQLLEPVGISIGPDGLVYVADTGNARISVFQKDGTPVTQIPVPQWTGQFGQQSFLRFGSDGLLYISSPGNGSVLVWNGADFAETAQGVVSAPVGIAIAADGTLMISDTSASKVDQIDITLPEGFVVQQGTPAGASGTPGATPVATPANDPAATPDAVG